MANTVREVMTDNPKTIEAVDADHRGGTVDESEDVGSIPIAEGDRLTGILTDRDIVLRLVADGKDPQAAAGEIASKDLVTVDRIRASRRPCG